MNNIQGTLFDLLLRIKNLQYLVITAEQQYGFNSPEALRYSDELDKLTVQLQNS